MNHPSVTALPHPTDTAARLARQANRTLSYAGVPEPAGVFWFAVLIALALHATILLDSRRNPAPVRPAPVKTAAEQLEWAPTPEDPPVVQPSELSDPPPAVTVPSLTDIPTLVPIDTAFIQPLDLSPKIDPAAISTATIPISYTRDPRIGPGNNVFNPSDLERAPEAVVRTPPDYPFDLKRSGINGSVRVQFIVDHHGNVVSPKVISSTNRGFERAALEAVVKWRFRPGVKNGGKVNTRIEQQIDFTIES